MLALARAGAKGFVQDWQEDRGRELIGSCHFQLSDVECVLLQKEECGPERERESCEPCGVGRVSCWWRKRSG